MCASIKELKFYSSFKTFEWELLIPCPDCLQVMIIRGKDKGEKGVIKRVIRSQNRVIVEGKNLVRPTEPCSAFPHVPSSRQLLCFELICGQWIWDKFNCYFGEPQVGTLLLPLFSVSWHLVRKCYCLQKLQV